MGLRARSSATCRRASACASWCTTRRASAARARCSRRAGVDCRPRRLVPHPDRPVAGRATTARSSSAPRTATVGHRRLALQRLGEVPEPQARRRGPPAAGAPAPRYRCGCRPPSSTVRNAASCSRAAPSTSTAAARCSRPRSACSSPIQARNPGLDRAALERVLGEHLGVRKVLWLGDGIAGDDTHGHVDDLARFVDARTVVVAVCERPRRRQLRAAAGEPRAAARHDRPGRHRRCGSSSCRCRRRSSSTAQRLPASYANFYIANAAVLVPTFNDPADRRRARHPRRGVSRTRVVGIHAVDLVLGLGTLHCMTQQEPG